MTRRPLALLAILAGTGALVRLRRTAASVQFRPVDALAPAQDLSGSPLAAGTFLADRLGIVGGNARVLGPVWEHPTLAAFAEWVPGAPTSAATRALAYLWAAPLTAVGLLLGASAGVRPVVRDGVVLFPGARGPAGALLRAQGYAATTLGHAVIATRDPSPSLMAHELVHVRQAERFGALFAPLYGLLWAVYGYGRHPMERAARLGGRRAGPAAPAG